MGFTDATAQTTTQPQVQAQPSMPISSTVKAVPRSGIRDVFDRALNTDDVISLCVGEPSHTAAPHVVEAAVAAARDGKTKYSDINGLPEFRKVAADYSRRVKKLDYDPRTEVQAVDGGTIGLFLAIGTVVAPGDEVIIPSPYFTSYPAAVVMCGGKPVPVALKPEHGMHLNAADIEAAVTDRTRAIVINSPGNPSGAVTTAEELADIARLCIEHNIWAISDEVYHAIVYNAAGEAAPSIAAAPGMKDRTIIVDSLSKTYAMTGWRIGYLLAPAQVIEQTGKIAENLHSSVNSLSQYAGIAAMSGPQDMVERMRQEYLVKRQIVVDELAGSPVLRLVEPEGAFYAFVDVRGTGMDSDDFSNRLLDECRVAVVPGEAFGEEGRGFVRLSYAGDADELREGLRRIRTFAERQ